jgi:ferric-dicitrate binding protein FerR (iron transport regulator)
VSDELDRLIQGYLDDALSDDEARRLHELLKSSPDRLDDFIRAVDLHGSLSGMRAELARGGSPAAERAKRTRRATRRVRQAPSTGSWVWGLVAAGILFALLLFGVFGGDSAEPERTRVRDLQARRHALERERARAEEESLRAQARLKEIEEKLTATPPSPKPEAPMTPKVDLAQLKAEKERIERELEAAVRTERQAKEELARIPEPAPEPQKAPEPPKPAPTISVATGLATLSKVDGEVFIVNAGDRALAKGGENLYAGNGLAVTGAATFVYADGTRVEVGANTEIRDLKTDGGKRFTLVRGEARAVVAKQPKDQPMIVASAHAEAKVVGTSLRLVTEEGAKGFTRLEVTEGKVQFKKLPEGKTVDVAAGQFAVASASGELTPRPIPPADILLTVAGGRIVGKDWKLSRDAKASLGQALESIEIGSDDSGARLKAGSMGYVEWTFMAESGRDYTIWIRGMSSASSMPDAHDALVLEVPDCKVTEPDGPWKGGQGVQRALVNGYGKHPSYCWLGGDGDNNREAFATTLRFTQYGKQTLRLYPSEGPLRVDALWISLGQKARPEDDQLGPAQKPRK